jgi:hypothetical protein
MNKITEEVSYAHFVDHLEKIVHSLGSEFPKPAIVKFNELSAYRHPANVRSDILASFLKSVRIVSLLNASLCLLEKGFVQESNILCRAIDEATEDITFFALNIGETGTSDKQVRLLKEFYQEQHENPEDFLSSKSRERVPRKDIRSAISNMPISSSDPHTRRTVTKALFETFSGYVHGPYVFIMELYGGEPAKYHMKGTPELPYMSDSIENFANHIYRSVLAVETIAYRVNRKDIAALAIQLSITLAKATSCLDDEGIAMRERILSFVSKEPA